ncbi:hypothetical protein [Chromobacterium piscinae]|uniref:hypothetical protein n=1 Tax=Chromobacterium piscinae TaxID=686831 RepID=UPI00320B1D91
MTARGTSQTAVARALSVSRFTVRRWLISKMPDPNQMAILAAFLDTSVSHLQNGESVDSDHALRCQYLHDLATGMNAGDVEAMIRLAESIRATKMLQK